MNLKARMPPYECERMINAEWDVFADIEYEKTLYETDYDKQHAFMRLEIRLLWMQSNDGHI